MSFFDDINDVIKGLGITLLIAVGVLGIMLVVDWLWWDYLDFVGPKHEDTKREIFESTKSYNEGMAQQLARYWNQYYEGNASARMMIKSTIQMMYADFDFDKLRNNELAQWGRDMLGGY